MLAWRGRVSRVCNLLPMARNGASYALPSVNALQRNETTNLMPTARSFHTSKMLLEEEKKEPADTESEAKASEEEIKEQEDSGNEQEEDQESEKENLLKKIDEMKDRLLRQIAETDNVRKMGQSQITDAKKFGLQGLMKDFVSLLDTFDLVMEKVNVKEDEDNEHARELKNFHQAMSMFQKELHKTLGNHGVERYHPEGEEFDPDFHEALFQAPHEEVPKNNVMQVVKTGYLLNKRVIRPAGVGVSTGPPEKKD